MSQSPLPTPSPGVIAIGSLDQAHRHKRRYDAVLTLEDPEAWPRQQLRFHRPNAPAHLILQFEDVDDAGIGIKTATFDDVTLMLQFGRNHAFSSMLVHCFHGIGRSTAAAYAILADRHGPGSETKALEHVLRIRPQACPNRVVVAIADKVLWRRGDLLAALDDWETRTPAARASRQLRRDDVTKNPEQYAISPERMPDSRERRFFRRINHDVRSIVAAIDTEDLVRARQAIARDLAIDHPLDRDWILRQVDETLASLTPMNREVWGVSLADVLRYRKLADDRL